MRKLLQLTKVLLTAVLLGVGASAWGEDVEETYDLNSWGQSHMDRNTYATMGTTSAGFSVNSVPMNQLVITSQKDAAVYDLSSRFAVSSNVTFRWGKGGSDYPRLGTENASGTFYVSIVDLKEGDRVSFTLGGTITFYSSNATYDDSGTPTAVVGGTTTVTSGTTYTVTGAGTQRLDLTFTQGWNSITKIVVTRTVACAEPTKTMTGAYNNNRKFTLACATDGATIYYSETERAAGGEGWTTYSGEVTTSATKIWTYASKNGGNSAVVDFETGAGTTLALNAPTVELTDFTKSGDTYYPQYTFSSNQASVLGNPAVTYTYTIAGEANSTPSPTSYTEAKAGELIVTAHAEGYTSTSAVAKNVLPYLLSKSWDFSKTYTLNANWSEVSGKTGMPSGTYDINNQRYNIASDIDVSAKDVLIGGLTFSQNYHDLYYFVQGLGLGYSGGSGHNTTTITVDGLTANDYTIYKKYKSGSPNVEENAVVEGNNTWTLGKMSGTGAHILRGIYVYSPDPVVLAIADCKKHETSSAFATYIDGGSYTTAAEVYAAHTAWQISNGVATDGIRDITKVIRNAGVSSTSNWTDSRVIELASEVSNVAPDNFLIDAYNQELNTYQIIYNLPAGKYIVKAATRATETCETGKIYVYAEGQVDKNAEGNHVGNTGGDLDHGWSWTSIDFELTAASDVKLGYYVDATSSKWASCDDWHIYKVETVSKSITAAGWATYCSPYALDLEHATGLTDAYIVTGGTNGVLAKTSVKDGTVPANTGLLLKGAEGTATIPVVASSETSVAGNILVGKTAAEEIAAESGWVLMGTPSLGFYQNSIAFTVGANTAYIPVASLPVPAGGASDAPAFYSLFDDMTTGISAMPMNNEGMNKAVFNLAGQRVSQPTKGLYIVGGRKVMVK